MDVVNAISCVFLFMAAGPFLEKLFLTSASQNYYSTGIFRDAVIGILAAIAKQERVRLAERTRAGLDRVRREGKRLGRPVAKVDVSAIPRMREQGQSWSEISRRTGLARATVQRACVQLAATGLVRIK